MRLWTLGALATLALLAGCGDDNDKTNIEGGDPPVYTEADLAKTIDVEGGTTFEIVLPSNVTTGYSWQLEEEPDPDVVTFDESIYEPEPGTEDQVGAGGQERLVFDAHGIGKTRLVLAYKFTGAGGDDGEVAERETVRIAVH